MSKKALKSKDFETSVKELEDIIKKMESGDLSLENSLKSFEQGINLTSHCQELLNKAEQKVQILMDKQEEQFQEFELDDDPEYEEEDEDEEDY